MIDVLNLALPFFGLIFIGFACGKLKQIPDTALAWMNFFILYVALPALFYRILAQTPLEQLAQVDFIFATTLATFWAFAVSFAIGMAIRRGNIAEVDDRRARRRLRQYRLSWARAWRWRRSGPQAAVPVALIFCFDNMHPVHHGAVPDGAGEAAAGEPRRDRARGGQAHRAASADHRQRARRRLGGAAFPAAGRARPADAVPAERRGALRAVHARRDGGAAAVEEDAVGGAVPHAGEARRPPDAGLSAAVAVRAVRPDLGLYRAC